MKANFIFLMVLVLLPALIIAGENKNIGGAKELSFANLNVVPQYPVSGGTWTPGDTVYVAVVGSVDPSILGGYWAPLDSVVDGNHFLSISTPKLHYLRSVGIAHVFWALPGEVGTAPYPRSHNYTAAVFLRVGADKPGNWKVYGYWPFSVTNPGYAAGVASAESIYPNLPKDFFLAQNYPNPFNPSTTIRYSLAESGNVKLTIYDMLGKQVAVLADGFQPAGEYQAKWNAGHLPSGNYFCRLEINDEVILKKMTLLK